jgi:hypothetical protein
MEYTMRNGMEVFVDYDTDPYDDKCMEIRSVRWRGVDVFPALTVVETQELYDACYEAEWDRARMAREDRYDMAREGV